MLSGDMHSFEMYPNTRRNSIVILKAMRSNEFCIPFYFNFSRLDLRKSIQIHIAHEAAAAKQWKER